MKKLTRMKALNWTQFLGAYNDNLFKFLTIFLGLELLVENGGGKEEGFVLMLAGALSTLPFLLFSDAGGVIADRRSKSDVIVKVKLAEIIIMAIGLIGFVVKEPYFVMAALFFMSIQSAYFGPAKYGIIPELVEEEELPQANASISAMTFAAIILGQISASVLNLYCPYIVSSLITVLIAVVGYVFSKMIPHVEAVGSQRKISPLFFAEATKTLWGTRKSRYLYASIIALSFFWFLAAYVQLNIQPFGMKLLGLKKETANYLFVSCSFGIGLGSFIAGVICKGKVKLGLVAWSCLGLLLSLIGLSYTTTVITTCLGLAVFGIFSGIYCLPLNTYIQKKSPDSQRGKVLAATNFFNFTGILLAAVAIGNTKHPANGYLMMGIILLIFALIMFIRFPEFYRSYRRAKNAKH